MNSQILATKQNIEIFHFSSFDKSWKTDDKWGVGAYWDFGDKHEKLKF